MNISCEVIKDLLPLFYDGVCSEESKKLVVEHLSCCEKCSKEFNLGKDDFSIENREKNINESEYIQKLSKRWKRGMFKSLLKGVLIAIVVIALLFLFIYPFMGIQFVPKA